MASMGIHSALPKLSKNHSFLSTNKPNSAFLSNSLSSSISIATRKSQEHALRAVSPASSNACIETHPLQHSLATPDPPPPENPTTSLQKIDSWMEKSVAEIVKNLKNAPLLVQIYSQSDGGVRIHAGEAAPDEWSALQSDWRRGDVKSPDGLIYVEELDHDGGDGGDVGPATAGEGVTRAWGICVQGRGVEAGPACYLLKTNRVCGGLGLGFCTHFCVMRVRNFRDGAFEQFKDAWLLR